jgi:nucleotide-binding universal stress UspA family protein
VIEEVADANDVAAIIVGSRGLSPIRSALLAATTTAVTVARPAPRGRVVADGKGDVS